MQLAPKIAAMKHEVAGLESQERQMRQEEAAAVEAMGVPPPAVAQPQRQAQPQAGVYRPPAGYGQPVYAQETYAPPQAAAYTPQPPFSDPPPRQPHAPAPTSGGRPLQPRDAYNPSGAGYDAAYGTSGSKSGPSVANGALGQQCDAEPPGGGDDDAEAAAWLASRGGGGGGDAGDPDEFLLYGNSARLQGGPTREEWAAGKQAEAEERRRLQAEEGRRERAGLHRQL